jgi:hypothetical protein
MNMNPRAAVKSTCEGRARDGERPLPLLIVPLRSSADVLLLFAPATPDEVMAAAAALGFRKWGDGCRTIKYTRAEIGK